MPEVISFKEREILGLNLRSQCREAVKRDKAYIPYLVERLCGNCPHRFICFTEDRMP